MTIKNLVASISYLEFINNITSLFNKLLYNNQDGYLYTKSKKAIVGACDVVRKFNYEAQKILSSFSYSDDNEFISKKRNELIFKIQQHYNSELLNWADDIFDEFIDNLFLDLSLNKDKSQNLYNSMISAINWIADIKNFDKIQYLSIVDKLNCKFNSVLQKNDSDYLPDTATAKTKCSDFLSFWYLILDDTDKFLEIDFSQEFDKLNQEDIYYFKSAQNNLVGAKRVCFIDELFLIKTALDEISVKNDVDKYNFIKQINADFNIYSQQNKQINEDDKVKLAKRRIAIFKDSNSKEKNYFKKLLTSSSV